jgi:uncharacterized protein YecE (DUF72 family)
MLELGGMRIRICHLTKDHQAYVIVNNRSEGNAPLMIQALMRALQ